MGATSPVSPPSTMRLELSSSSEATRVDAPRFPPPKLEAPRPPPPAAPKAPAPPKSGEPPAGWETPKVEPPKVWEPPKAAPRPPEAPKPPPSPPAAPKPPPAPASPAFDAPQLLPTAVMQVTPAMLAQLRESAAAAEAAPTMKLGPTGAAPVPYKGGEPTIVRTTPSELLAKSLPEGEDAVFRGVFEKFVATRKECGEAGELSFSKFVQRLEQSKQAVIEKHACKDVKFEVYVKNGKAALKATPL
jgi:hypothetical protein